MPDPSYLFVGLVVSGVGFVLLMYGRKQSRPLHLVAGLLLLLFPFLVRDAFWLGMTGGAVCLALWASTKAGL